MRRLAAAVCLLALLGAPAALAGSGGHVSFTDVENDFMCVSCHEPLAVAQSPQAYAERAYIKSLIAHGENKAQIERNLVAQYGPSVLARPPARGFNLTVYILPPALVVLGLLLLAVLLPRWRARAQAASRSGAVPALSRSDAQRLEDDLARFPG